MFDQLLTSNQGTLTISHMCLLIVFMTKKAADFETELAQKERHNLYLLIHMKPTV